jgi:hypothetical protein
VKGKNNLKTLMKQWEDGPVTVALSQKKERKETFQTDSGIPIEHLYTRIDLENIRFDYVEDLGFPGQYHDFEKRFQVKIQTIYSLTEAVLCIMGPREGTRPRKPGSIGVPMEHHWSHTCLNHYGSNYITK